ncbi:hypothetical protein K9L97_03475 [Candidatus Woesearchaeota archaeon]|nr:hypothetical protein [Candidatus Woesearchaeota archaeon]
MNNTLEKIKTYGKDALISTLVFITLAVATHEINANMNYNAQKNSIKETAEITKKTSSKILEEPKTSFKRLMLSQSLLRMREYESKLFPELEQYRMQPHSRHPSNLKKPIEDSTLVKIIDRCDSMYNNSQNYVENRSLFF